MDYLELIFKKLEGLEKGQERMESDIKGLRNGQVKMESDIKGLKNGQEKMESDIKALRADNREIHRKLDNLSTKVDLTWQAVGELNEDHARIDLLEKRVDEIEKKLKII
ncbi:hypothetical protein [Desulfitobacterium sp. PCE1]|uniref:hypothetical protein n=1 Tax=Desulfitobacterium sp. PCE1 TaxID=146907 RepID=UPI000371C421|nr:hypothetical protein [Desulfitobacterium sp. PCE1]